MVGGDHAPGDTTRIAQWVQASSYLIRKTKDQWLQSRKLKAKRL